MKKKIAQDCAKIEALHIRLRSEWVRCGQKVINQSYQIKPMKNHTRIFILAAMAFLLTSLAQAADPRTNSWFTAGSSQYARIYTSNVNKTNGTAVTTWSTGTTTQPLPVYCGVQEIYSSSNWVYIRSSGLGSHVMGPWYLNAAQTQAFPN